MGEETGQDMSEILIDDGVHIDVEGAIARIRLDRQKALNALNLAMIEKILPWLDRWAKDPSIQAVVIAGAGEKSFCAGGDVRAVWEAGKRGDDLTDRFFRQEYRLNRAIHIFPKPFIALIDGITMGGGLGLSVHGSHRVVTERSVVAMPETAIGLFPDVGATWFLPRCPGELGMYLALTGARMKAADVLGAGIATHYVPSDKLASLEALLASADWSEGPAHAVVDHLLDGIAQDPGPAVLSRHSRVIDRCFGQPSVEAILAALEADGSDFAAETAAILRSRSPTSMKIAFAQLRRGASLNFDEVMKMEFRMSQACMAGHDFYEGIRAVLIDKDHKPAWNPARLEDVGPDLVERHFAPLGPRELSFE